jgi:hypothetical protein
MKQLRRSLQQQQLSSKSAQGVVTIQDMAELDVVAHHGVSTVSLLKEH